MKGNATMTMTKERAEANDALRAGIEAQRSIGGGTIRLTLPPPPPVNALANRLLRTAYGCADENGENDDDQSGE